MIGHVHVGQFGCGKGENKRGITWTITQTLEDIDYADDIALLAHRHQDMQGKTDGLVTYSKQIGLNINIEKTKLMKLY